jgi:hypothetical protein
MLSRRVSFLLMMTLSLLLFSIKASADVVLEKKLIRRFEINWCPFFGQLGLHFIATTSEATLTFHNEGSGESAPARIDNIAVVDEDNLFASDPDISRFRSGAYDYPFDLQCYAEPFFHLDQAPESDVVFQDVFADSNLPGWQLDNASWISAPSAPISELPTTPNCNLYYSKSSQDTGSLKLNSPQSSASVRLHNLQIGKKYFVTGWLYSGISNLSMTVESLEPLSKKSESFASNGGNGSVVVSMQTSAWTAMSHSDWIMIYSVGTHPTGGDVSYSVAPNNGPRRSGTLTIAGNVFTVFQGANFLDVPPSHPSYLQIGKLSARGITSGCSDTQFCPDDFVTREQMAVLLLKATGLFNPPIPARQTFSDVPPSRYSFPHIEEFKQRAITQGCGPVSYCPDSLVTREQVAVFVIRGLGIYNPPTPAQQRFTDVAPSRASYPFVEEMALRNITSGCGVNLYCPDSPATRGQVAVFLVRAFGL